MSRRDGEFTDFVTDHRTGLLRVAFLLCRDWAQAEDIVQDALVKLYRAWPRLSADQGRLGYTRKIIATTAVDASRRPWRREVASSDWLDRSSTAVAGPDPTDRLTLAAALQGLPVRQRQVVVLRYFCELTVHETARELGVTEGTVKSHCARGIERLNTLLALAGAQDHEPEVTS